ncbi:MAG: FHA domain-containing protein [Planctomycetes bacterium]|nr:FHA domain-containing protein [Planctomycetota bacterium]
MSFRLFVYYCALCGGWAGFVGWMLGRLIHPDGNLARAGIRGMFLGMMIAFGLGLVDAVWSVSLRRIGLVAQRVGVAILVGAAGGLIGGLVGQALLNATEVGLMFVVGWVFTGLLVGISIAAFELLVAFVKRQDFGAVQKKMLKCLLGGTAGGLVGGLFALSLKFLLESNRSDEWLWSPTATGFVMVGMCIGLLVGLAQVILKEAWIKVEAGFRPGREMILAKERTTIGRAEACDIGLFGDNAIEKLHASILLDGNRYYLEDASTPAGTFVNDQRVLGRAPLQTGDLIRVGRSLLRFNERRKQTA